jgi:FkbM family methyltransferase
MYISLGKSTFSKEILDAYVITKFYVFVPEIGRNVVLRNLDTDSEVFKSIFMTNQYGGKDLPQDAEIIIDAGANVGYSVLYFKNKYPNAKIICIEPDPNNFEILKENCLGLSNIILINAALWSHDCELDLNFHNDDGSLAGSWGVRTQEISSNSEKIKTQAYSMSTIISELKLAKIDICKIDIEGAEKAVFSETALDWKNKVNLFIVETHDRFCPGSEEAVFSILNANDFEHSKLDENNFFRKRVA